MGVRAITRLDGVELGRALKAGIQTLQAAREHLDRINVFPVPDGDTGTNLALTMGAVLPLLKRPAQAHAGRMLAEVADAALDGARGNSGAILAQFLLGVGDHTEGLAELLPKEFAAAVAGGAAYAREALSSPREGTILSVLSAVGEELVAATEAGADDFVALLTRGLERGRRALEATRGQLDALARADVVDAGAAGFVALLEGMSGYLGSGIVEEREAAPGVAAEERDSAGGDECLEHRWCTECMLTGTDIDHRQLRERLAAIGSSLVVAGSRTKVRVHVHASEPAEVFRIAGSFGTVSAEKADDMQRQQEATLHARRRQVAVVTDSAADIPESELERLDIHVVPVRVHFGEQSFLDKVGITPEEFYERLASSAVHPKTSQPPAGDFRRTFEFLTSHYAHVVSVNATGRASGTRQAAESAASRLEASERVTVIDSLNASGGEGLVAMHAAECAAAGLGPEAVIASTREAIKRTHTFASPTTLDAGVRGGRVPAWARSVANVLHVSPYLKATPDGRIAIGGFLLGREDLTPKLARLVLRRLDLGSRYRVIVAHANAPREGERLLEHLRAARPGIAESWLVPLDPAIGVHGGPGMLVVSFQEHLPVAPAL